MEELIEEERLGVLDADRRFQILRTIKQIVDEAQHAETVAELYDPLLRFEQLVAQELRLLPGELEYKVAQVIGDEFTESPDFTLELREGETGKTFRIKMSEYAAWRDSQGRESGLAPEARR